MGIFLCNPVRVRPLIEPAIYLLLKCAFMVAAIKSTMIALIYVRTYFSRPTAYDLGFSSEAPSQLSGVIVFGVILFSSA